MQRVLYVGRDRHYADEYCPGSIVCMALVEQLHSKIEVQDCSILAKSTELPEWLNGTPIFVNRDDPEPRRGREAIQALREMLADERRRQDHSDAAVSAKQAVRAAPTRLQPEVTRTGVSKEDDMLHAAAPGGKSKSGGVQRESDEDELADDDDGFGNLNGEGNVPIRDDKVTEQDLQRFMEMRNQSPAAPKPQATQ